MSSLVPTGTLQEWGARERPIMFSSLMVNAILLGLKTQTRRVVKSQQSHWVDMERRVGPDGVEFFYVCLEQEHGLKPIVAAQRCPYGQPGDRLWIREAFGWCPITQEPVYRQEWERQNKPSLAKNFKWKPSIHMPRSASRILLEVVSVRVERLKSISQKDAVAEGVDGRYMLDNNGTVGGKIFSALEQFRLLWESIHDSGSWESNPLVWVVEFKVVR